MVEIEVEQEKDVVKEMKEYILEESATPLSTLRATLTKTEAKFKKAQKKNKQYLRKLFAQEHKVEILS